MSKETVIIVCASLGLSTGVVISVLDTIGYFCLPPATRRRWQIMVPGAGIYAWWRLRRKP